MENKGGGGIQIFMVQYITTKEEKEATKHQNQLLTLDADYN